MKKTLYVFTWACFAMLALPAAAQVPSYVPTDGLVGWWPFNGNANDESGNGNDGTILNATLSTDRFGNINASYAMDGTNCPDPDGISLPCNISNAGEYSISCWYLTTDSTKNYQTIFNSSPHGYIGTSYNYDTFSGPGDNLIQGGVGNGPWLNAGPSGNINWPTYGMANWHYIAVVKSLSEFKFYSDGILAFTYPINSDFNFGLFESVVVGANSINGGSGCYETFSGLLDDIAIYNRALTEQEIQNLYTGQCPTVATNCTSLPSNLQQGLVGYWPFCGNANDESGNGNDGTVNGATLTEDRFGNNNHAYSFDGINNHIVVENPVNLPIGNSSRTFSCWFNYQTSIQPPFYNDWNSLICYGEFGTNDCNSNYLLLNNDQSVLFASAGGTCASLNYDVPNILNSWHFVTVTYSDNIIKLFIDGQYLTEGTSNSLNTSITNLFFGIYNNQVQADQLYTLRGEIDDIGIWNRALTPEEVQELYTLDACMFTVYDTSYVTVYDTLTTYETVYDTLYTYETIYDTVTTYVTVIDTLLIDITSGIDGQPSWFNTVTVFPNPASDHITIDYGNFALMAGYNTVITDAAGATVYTNAVDSQQAYIDINAWGVAGVYYLSIYDANGALVAVRHIVLE